MEEMNMNEIVEATVDVTEDVMHNVVVAKPSWGKVAGVFGAIAVVAAGVVGTVKYVKAKKAAKNAETEETVDDSEVDFDEAK